MLADAMTCWLACCMPPQWAWSVENSADPAYFQRLLAFSPLKLDSTFIRKSQGQHLNLSIRQHMAALGRRALTRAQSPVGLSHQALLFVVYYNFCLTHASLRLPLDTPQATRGTGSPRRWQERTPAMAAGLTDHVWTLREVLLYRVPPVRPAQPVA